MTDLTFADFIWITAVCGALTVLVLWCLDFIWRRRADRSIAEVASQDRAHFLFRDDRLIDWDCWISQPPGTPDAPLERWMDLRDWLGDRFGVLPATLQNMKHNSTDIFAAQAADDHATLKVIAQNRTIRVILHDPELPNAAQRHYAKQVQQALSRDHAILDHVPCAIAKLDEKGTCIWRNQQFAAFSDNHAKKLMETDALSSRLCLPGQGMEKDRHIEVAHQQFRGGRVLYVTDVTKVVEAEAVRREFIQTLTKTFANLTTGLAVFDNHRRLALFNPALLDLTGLPAVFLSGQPPLALFFDKLRDSKMLPEPRNYCFWRGQIDDMISSATDGRYQEDWHLLDGLTYRVTGRPHPDGAIAFLFEDISDEVAMTRQIRTQLDIRQAALDTLDKAIAVVGEDRSIVLCNLPCTNLLGIDPDGSFADMSLTDFLGACQSRLSQASFWQLVEHAVQDRTELNHFFRAPDGGLYHCEVARIPGRKMKISIMQQLATVPDAIIKTPLAV